LKITAWGHCRDFCRDSLSSIPANTCSMLYRSSLSTALRLCSGVGCTYRIVVVILECPMSSFNVAKSTPAMAEREPKVCRKSYSRNFGLTPASRTAL